jgi:hypothetical protein
MKPNKSLWEKDDFTAKAATMRGSGETFVKTLGVSPGIKVLVWGAEKEPSQSRLRVWERK